MNIHAHTLILRHALTLRQYTRTDTVSIAHIASSTHIHSLESVVVLFGSDYFNGGTQSR